MLACGTFGADLNCSWALHAVAVAEIPQVEFVFNNHAK
jgi:hypothetical protein